jgi:hypothetical protein
MIIRILNSRHRLGCQKARAPRFHHFFALPFGHALAVRGSKIQHLGFAGGQNSRAFSEDFGLGFFDETPISAHFILEAIVSVSGTEARRPWNLIQYGHRVCGPANRVIQFQLGEGHAGGSPNRGSRAPRGEHEATSERDRGQLKLADNKAASFSVKAMKHRETIIALDDVKAFHAPPDIHRLP